MKFDKVVVDKKDYNIAFISWGYLPNHDLSSSNFFVRISLAGTKEGPFQVVGEVPSNEVFFSFPTFFRKWQYYYYKVEIVDLDGNVCDERIVELYEYTDPYVKAMRKKYDIYLSKKVQNPIYIYKKKKIGHKCTKCWDPYRDELALSTCNICYGTGYGDDIVYGLSDLKVDGWLKKNLAGNLEFVRPGWTFEKYPLIGEHLIDFGIFKGDEFRIENTNNNPELSLKVISAQKNSIHLNYNSDFFNHLDDTQFSVYGLEKIQNFDIHSRLVYNGDSQAWSFYSKGLNLDGIEFDSFGFDDSLWGAIRVGNHIEIGFDLDYIKSYSFENKIITLYKDDAVVYRYDPKDMLMFWKSEDYNEVSIVTSKTFENNDRLYIDYLFDGITEAIIEGKRTEIATPGNGLLYFTILNNADNRYYLKLESTSNYVFDEDISIYLYNYYANAICKSNLVAYNYRTNDRYVMFCQTKRLQSNTVYKLEHKNILKDTFAGCGVLLINTQEGIVYRGATWNGESYDDDGDFYVNPDMTEINTLDLPDGPYELTYIYKAKALRFDSFFVPVNYKITNGKLDTTRWKFKHPSLINKEELVGKKLSISEKDIYEEFDIVSYNKEMGIIIVSNTVIDSDSFFNSLTEKAIFQVINYNTGGYYKAINSWINYANPLHKSEDISEAGSVSEVGFQAITYFYPRLEPDDLIFDVKTKIFYDVLKVETPFFKRSEIYQKIEVREPSGSDQSSLFRLLSRN